jgi:hypothetical protein
VRLAGAGVVDRNGELDMSEKKFTIGGPDEALVVLWARGDEPADIADRFKLSLAQVEEAIKRHGHKYKRRSQNRTRRP